MGLVWVLRFRKSWGRAGKKGFGEEQGKSGEQGSWGRAGKERGKKGIWGRAEKERGKKGVGEEQGKAGKKGSWGGAEKERGKKELGKIWGKKGRYTELFTGAIKLLLFSFSSFSSPNP